MNGKSAFTGTILDLIKRKEMETLMRNTKNPIGHRDDLAHQLALINQVLTVGFEATIKNKFAEDLAFLKSIQKEDIIALKKRILQKLLNA